MFKKFLVTNNDVFIFLYLFSYGIHIYKIECPISIQIHALYDSV